VNAGLEEQMGPGTNSTLRVIKEWRAVPGRARRGAALALAGLALAALTCGCDWLSTATPAPPSTKRIARTVPLSAEPESTLANIVEAFRVGSVQAYMRSIYSGATLAEDFQALFDQADINTLPTDDASRQLMVSGWHYTQEQNAISSVMNGIINAEPDDKRVTFTGIIDDGPTPEGRVLHLTYRANIPVGASPYVTGSARLTLRQNSANEWQIREWFDIKDPGKASWGEMRFKNKS
jgi:hypothetical protein